MRKATIGRGFVRTSLAETGFTLIELIVVLVILGTLSAVAAPRWQSFSEYSSAATRDEMVAALLYTQQLAMMDRSSTVTFTTSSSSYSITVNGSAISLPEGGGSYPRNIDPAVSLSPATTLTFDALGAISSATTFNLSGGLQICVATSGFAYAC